MSTRGEVIRYRKVTSKALALLVFWQGKPSFYEDGLTLAWRGYMLDLHNGGGWCLRHESGTSIHGELAIPVDWDMDYLLDEDAPFLNYTRFEREVPRKGISERYHVVSTSEGAQFAVDVYPD